jgi:UDP-galactopyranose mutase
MACLPSFDADDRGETMQGRIGIAGAGLSGATIAHCLAMADFEVVVFDERPHPGGNCYTRRDAQTGVMVHRYGPHIFHTDDAEVWEFVNRFAEFVPFENRVKAVTRGEVFSLPINLHTINQFFRRAMSPAEARTFIEARADSGDTVPKTFEEQALRFVGRELYEAFFKGYTEKQWGCSPAALPASILKRLPLRFNYNDNYYSHRQQGIPRHGYAVIFEGLLAHPHIELRLRERFPLERRGTFDHVFFTGPLDSFFGYSEGRLDYRTLDFEEIRADGDFQGNALVNYCDAAVPYTRVMEHKHFATWESHAQTIVHREYSRACGDDDVPFYPLRLVQHEQRLTDYMTLAERQSAVSFVGRLGTYRYLDMDVSVREALDAAREFLRLFAARDDIPVFFRAPL